MRKLIVAAFLFALAAPSSAAYFQEYFQDNAHLAHPQVSAGADWTMKGNPDGGVTKIALVYHAADPNDSIIPKAWQNVIPPDSWCALCAGFQVGNHQTYSLKFGPSVNLEPQVLGWAVPLLQQSSNPVANAAANLIGGSPKGGLAFGVDWGAKVVQGGTIEPFNKWGFSPDFYAGALYRF